MKKFLYYTLGIVTVALLIYFLAVYYLTYSQGYRAGELVKFSHKGLIFKTWEGEISQGVSEGQIFVFSVEDHEKELIQQLVDYQGAYVRLKYKERFKTFPWLGDSKYFVTEVEKTERNKLYEH
ncbi:6-phosphogluconate dehydrogenase [Lutibacter sp. HS1-25]|uniref:6-phosphogluconate dehydrogenase n=1 Tax=Lutibacter sp. HS1-25 TaxID=2485000 RepID=UPI001013ABB8|nr:6-phosphogluconate dehydrogenase [Lutibacter sp. HS1-25]RXP64409.1 6-phosphogluconate dehydrogenase [Lutibacter sp. HS1-25]